MSDERALGRGLALDPRASPGFIAVLYTAFAFLKHLPA
jgi:hypothetical protein